MSGLRLRRTAAFTLIELLVVIAIIGVLAGISLPIFNSVQQSSRATKCLSNVKQLAAASFTYAADNNERLPNKTVDTTGGQTTLYPQLLWSYVSTAKYIGYQGTVEPPEFVSTIFHCPEVVNDAKNYAGFQNYRSYGMNYYMGNGGDQNGVRLTSIPHPPTTMMYCDAYNNTYAYAKQLAKRHLGQCNVVFCDGHAEKIVPTAAMVGNSTAYVTADPFWGDRSVNPNQ